MNFLESRDVAEDSPVLQQVREAAGASDVARAVGLARKALDDGHEHPLLLNLRAYWYEQQGRLGEAVADLQRAHALAPKDAIIGNALGLCLARIARFWEARRAFQDAARHQPDFAPAHFNHGWVAEELGLLDEAREAFLRAEQIDPSSASPPARLSYLAARAADLESARRHAARALAIDSGEPMAHLALATCEFEDGRFHAAETRLRRLLADGRIGSFDRALALGLLGDCLDAGARSQEAFAAYTESNRELSRLHAPLFGGASAETASTYLERIARHFEATDGGAWKRKNEVVPEMSPVAGHVFIVGFPRSGTTLVEEVLAGHPLVCTTGERDGLEAGVREYLATPDGLDRLSQCNATELLVFRERYWRKLRDLGLEFRGKVLVDKQPYNTVKLPLISKLFPDARIVFVTRDPRDVVFSCFRSRFSMNRTNYELLTLEGAAKLYDRVMRLAELFRARLPLMIHDLRYEDLIDDFGGRTAAVFRFVGLEGRDAVWDPAKRTKGRGIATPSAVQIARGLNRESLGVWRRYANHIGPVLPVLEPWIQRFGIPASQPARYPNVQ